MAKAETDAPNYREAEEGAHADTNEACATCRFFQAKDNQCTRFEFETERVMVCDDWKAKENGKGVLHRTFAIDVVERRKDGGRIVISTGSFDRARDRVNPLGGKFENYLRNPVVQWGHNYYEPWATIGRTTDIEVNTSGITAAFELREPASANDPQHIIRQLWQEEWVRASSIGFNPLTVSENQAGGRDFNEWELLEWSLVPIPMNQEALRMTIRSTNLLPLAHSIVPLQRAGRVLSKTNEGKIRQAVTLLSDVLQQLADTSTEEEDESKADNQQVETLLTDIRKLFTHYQR
jgi:hypothetical protein